MTPEEKEKYYAKYRIEWDGAIITGYVKKSDFVNGIDEEHQYIMDSINYDLLILKDYHREISEIPDNLDSE
jgi:hypothetical protein